MGLISFLFSPKITDEMRWKNLIWKRRHGRWTQVCRECRTECGIHAVTAGYPNDSLLTGQTNSPTTDSSTARRTNRMLTEDQKADKMRDAIRKTCTEFREAGNHALADQTFKVVEDGYNDNSVMARLFDIFSRGLSKDEALEAIETGAV